MNQFKYKKSDSLKTFISCIKILQQLNGGFIFHNYKNIYNKFYKNFFRLSSVSICFRLALRLDIINRLNKEEKLKIKEDLLEYVSNPKNYLKFNKRCLNIETLKVYLNEKFFKFSEIKKEIDDLFSIEILLVKRATVGRDKYSGNVAFPGGKFEKEDQNDYTTAVRETSEEIGINLNEDSPIVSRYLGSNPRFDITIDFKYIVSSHVFLIFDFFRETESLFVISPKELSDIFYVPLDYIFNGFQEKNVRKIPQKILRENTKINKFVLNNNEEFLVYGMTLRKIINLLNIGGNKNVNIKEEIDFLGRFPTIKKYLFKLFYFILQFITDPFNSYRLMRNVLILILFLYVSNTIFTMFRIKF